MRPHETSLGLTRVAPAADRCDAWPIVAAWQTRKYDEIEHPYLKERISIGLVPYVQALLMARYIRGGLDAYPAFFWR